MGQCKAPEAETCLACPRNQKEASEARAEGEGERSQADRGINSC